MENLNLNTGEDDDLVIEPDHEELASPELCVVGRFLMEQSVNFNVLRSRIAATWKPMRGVSIRDIGQGRFLFQFYHILNVQRVMGVRRGLLGTGRYFYIS